MTRKKVKLAFIANDSARKATYKKRKKGLIKKVDELTTLCGIEACAIVYSPYDPQPEIWPSAMGVQRVLSKFRRMPELEQSKKMVNQEGFLKQRIVKAKEQVKKQRKENREKEMTQIMYQYLSAGKILHNMTMADLNDLAWLIEQNLKEIGRRVEVLEKRGQSLGQGQGQAAAAAVDVAARNRDKAKVEEVEVNGDVMNMMMPPKQQWFMDLMNGGGAGDETLPFGDVNHPNPFWHNHASTTISSSFFSQSFPRMETPNSEANPETLKIFFTTRGIVTALALAISFPSSLSHIQSSTPNAFSHTPLSPSTIASTNNETKPNSTHLFITISFAGDDEAKRKIVFKHAFVVQPPIGSLIVLTKASIKPSAFANASNGNSFITNAAFCLDVRSLPFRNQSMLRKDASDPSINRDSSLIGNIHVKTPNISSKTPTFFSMESLEKE
ncbi:agamous-like MADS-box protein AGL80 [Senna tora]|uniref:Agamous-like MADS-box protein AGL80 n=1 Tax=Senna tora TaxID=362788 RepID=A0A834T8W5_9FABA|nr:agamous-like MADS-box protein AGL80 [Senna tora]